MAFENRILRRIFGLERIENGEWKSIQNVELPSLYRSLNKVRVVKFRRIRGAGHLVRNVNMVRHKTFRKETFRKSEA